jgi:hypothetical protein
VERERHVIEIASSTATTYRDRRMLGMSNLISVVWRAVIDRFDSEPQVVDRRSAGRCRYLLA